MTGTTRYWAVIPAAGTGTRMQSEVPKQYLAINGKKIIEYSLETFCRHPEIAGIKIALSAQDRFWPALPVSKNPKISTAPGGKERCHSVLNCLQALSASAKPEDWVLVHDAARPCINVEDINHLITELKDHAVGGLLALPVRDTMKRADADQSVCETVSRDGLWHALTPQMFRLGALQQALETAINRGHLVTDESQAMELAGAKPMLVRGRPENIKITHISDLELAELYLSQL